MARFDLTDFEWSVIDGVDAPSHNGIAMCQTGFVGSQFKKKGSIHVRD